MKNETLKNMMIKLSEDAKRQISDSEKRKNESYLDEFDDLEDIKSVLNLEFFKIADEKEKEKEKLRLNNNLNINNNNNLNQNFQNVNNVNRQGNPFSNNNINPNSNFNYKNEEPNNENFTQEFYMERYKNFLPSKIVTPSDFNKNVQNYNTQNFFNTQNNNFSRSDNNLSNNLGQSDHNKLQNNLKSSSSNNIPLEQAKIFQLISAKYNSEILTLKSTGLDISNWLKVYNELHQNKKITIQNYFETYVLLMREGKAMKPANSIIEKLESFFNGFSFKSEKEVVIGQIVNVKLIDCLQILELVDFAKCKREIIVTDEDLKEVGNISAVLRDDQFTMGEVVLIRACAIGELKVSDEKMLYTVALKNINQMN
jgi:hypothetical protein